MSSDKDSVSISVVVPVFNEEATLGELIRRLTAVMDGLSRSHEILLVDDGSSDATPSIIEEASNKTVSRIVGVFLNRNYGQHAAVMAGFAQSRGEVVVTLDADLQNPPEEIPKLVAKLDEGFDVVGSVRVPREDSAFRRLASYITNRAVQKATGVNMHDYGCMLRGYRRSIVKAMLQCHERSTFIPVLANSFARRTTEVEVSHAPRPAGGSKYSLWKLINLQFDLLTSMTTFPIRLLSLLGTLISITGIGFGLFLLLMRLIQGPEWAVQGVFTLFAILFVFVGAQFIGLGLLGEYLGRVYYDVRARPRYFVQRVTGREAPE
ncbi:MAG: Undecaprenyl-phosphate 4-deoxy-4-formamido-L-arabinose transferase [Verrucomicrobia bacterium ADurb.Bin345]|nr:MAG: Undecaprenyl-phosphate 4-deoxy-4-formamido-L-arabinose transferase [Verrucomicrobia bacterium ADurb.Bin345]